MTIKIKFNTLKVLLHCCGNRKKMTIQRYTELLMQSAERKARRKWGDGKMLSFPTVLPPQCFYKGKQNQNSSVPFSGKPLDWEKKDEGVWGFSHIKPYSISSFFFAITLSGCPQQQDTDPKWNKSWGTCSALPKRTPKERSDLLRTPVWPHQTPRLRQKWETRKFWTGNFRNGNRRRFSWIRTSHRNWELTTGASQTALNALKEEQHFEKKQGKIVFLQSRGNHMLQAASSALGSATGPNKGSLSNWGSSPRAHILQIHFSHLRAILWTHSLFWVHSGRNKER